jgi:hypothetical protein
VVAIPPLSISVAVEGDSSIDDCCTARGMTSLQLDDGSIYWQVCYFCKNAVETIISPQAIVDSSDVFQSWHQTGYRHGDSTPGCIRFDSHDGLINMHMTLVLHDRLHYCPTDVCAIDTMPALRYSPAVRRIACPESLPGLSAQNSNLEKMLLEDYNKQLTIKDVNKEDKQNLKDIFRQMNRFMYCVQNIKYKLSIFYKNYLCSITKDDELDCFLILNYPRNDNRKLYIYIDLKTLYIKMETFPNDVRTVKDGIYRLLNQNQIKHTKVLNDMLEQKITILQYSEVVQKKKEDIQTYITQFETLLTNLNLNEKSIYEKLEKVRSQFSDYGIKGLHDDIEKSHLTAHYESELEKINNVKQDIIQNIVNLKTQQENITLKMDKILFDNSIMINEISKNFIKLAEIVG